MFLSFFARNLFEEQFRLFAVFEPVIKWASLCERGSLLERDPEEIS